MCSFECDICHLIAWVLKWVLPIINLLFLYIKTELDNAAHDWVVYEGVFYCEAWCL
jgi:hypothetical protein